MPWHTLKIGTTILVMQQSPSFASIISEITTSIAIVFPRPKGGGTGRKVMEGIKESSKGGTFRVCISKVAADVTREDVLDALPPAFPGGRGKLPIKRGRQRKQGRLNEAASKLTNHTGSGGSPNAPAATSLAATSDASRRDSSEFLCGGRFIGSETADDGMGDRMQYLHSHVPMVATVHRKLMV